MKGRDARTPILPQCTCLTHRDGVCRLHKKHTADTKFPCTCHKYSYCRLHGYVSTKKEAGWVPKDVHVPDDGVRREDKDVEREEVEVRHADDAEPDVDARHELGTCTHYHRRECTCQRDAKYARRYRAFTECVGSALLVVAGIVLLPFLGSCIIGMHEFGSMLFYGYPITRDVTMDMRLRDALAYFARGGCTILSGQLGILGIGAYVMAIFGWPRSMIVHHTDRWFGRVGFGGEYSFRVFCGIFTAGAGMLIMALGALSVKGGWL